MTMKGFISKAISVATTGQPTNKRRGRSPSPTTKTKGGSQLMGDDTQRTCTTEAEGSSSSEHDMGVVAHPGWFEDAFFREELAYVRHHPEITKVTFKDFIQRHERDDLLALSEILKGDRRRWKSIKFQDSIEGANYRRWQFKKENLRRAVDQALKDAGIRDKVPICFEEHLEVDMDDMSRQAIVSLLREVQKDHHVTSLCLDGFIHQMDVESVVGILITLLKMDNRRWKSVVFRCSFDGDGDDYSEWDRKISLAKRRLEDVSAKRGIPIGVHVC